MTAPVSSSWLTDCVRRRFPAGFAPDPVSLRGALEGRLADTRKARGKRHELASLVSVLVAGVAAALSGPLAVAQAAAGWDQEVLAAHVPRVILGTTFPAGHLVEPGVVEMDTGGETWLGPFGEDAEMLPAVERLASLLTRSGMPTKALPDARGAQWNKLIFNAATNPLGALTGLSHGQVCEQPGLRALVSALIAEDLAVAAALGITLDDDPEALVDHAAEVAYGHRASMPQDVAAHRRTEIDSLNGGIAALGRRLGVPTPLNDAIVALVQGLESPRG